MNGPDADASPQAASGQAKPRTETRIGFGPAVAGRLGALRHLPALFAQVYAASPRLFAASLVVRAVRAGLPILALYLAKLILDAVVAEHARARPIPLDVAAWLDDPALARLAGLVAAELAVAVATDLLGRLTSFLDGLLGDLYSHAASLRLIRHAAALDLAQFEDPAQQDRLERARRQVTGRSGLLPQVLGQGQDLLTLATLCAGLAAFTPWLILLLAAALVPAFLNELHFNRRGYRLAWRHTPDRRRIDYLRYLGASAEFSKEVKLFGLSGWIAERFGSVAARLLSENRRLLAARTAWGGIFAALGTLAYYLAYAVIAWRTVAGTFSVGDLAFLAGSFQRLRGLIEGLLLGASQVSSQAQYLDDLFSFFSVQPSIRSPAVPAPLPSLLRQGFTFEEVGFRYPGAAEWAVRDLSFTLSAGEVVALVGENGAGKTTIVKLMTRLYDPQEGRILLEGKSLAAYDLGELRARIGVIFQDFSRYDLTAGENIAVGRIVAEHDSERIVRAAGQGLADSVIARLPGGYDQVLGRRFEGGVDLSGGQWQKVAIARSYMREAEVLVLDEPTAALDARAEYEVFRRFRDLSAGRTALLISHRFSTVRMADRILVVEGGRVIESGTHEALRSRGGRYAELFELQAAGYR